MDHAKEAGTIELAGLRSAWRALVKDWRLDERERRDLLPAGGDLAADAPADTRERIRLLVEIGHRLVRDDGDPRDWLRRPVLMLGLATPLETMAGPMPDLLRLRGLVERGFGS